MFLTITAPLPKRLHLKVSCSAQDSAPAPNLFALVSNETSRIWVSTEGWKPAVSLVHNGFYYYDKVQLRVQTQPRIETELETGPNKLDANKGQHPRVGPV